MTIMQNKLKYSWPEVFIKGSFEYDHKALAIADGLVGWALCKSGVEIPENFRKGMASIAGYLVIIASEKALEKLAKDLDLL